MRLGALASFIVVSNVLKYYVAEIVCFSTLIRLTVNFWIKMFFAHFLPNHVQWDTNHVKEKVKSSIIVICVSRSKRVHYRNFWYKWCESKGQFDNQTSTTASTKTMRWFFFLVWCACDATICYFMWHYVNLNVIFFVGSCSSCLEERLPMVPSPDPKQY